jgi:hypothetical protein
VSQLFVAENSKPPLSRQTRIAPLGALPLCGLRPALDLLVSNQEVDGSHATLFRPVYQTVYRRITVLDPAIRAGMPD